MNLSSPLLNSPWSVAIIGGAIATVIGSLTLKAMIEPLVLGVFFLGCFFWYWMILNCRNSATGSNARANYNRLRSNLRGVNKQKDTPFGEWYRREIADKLNGVSSWLSDADHPNSERLCRRLGMDQARPLWTAESFDRCLLFALLYPLTCLFIFWAITGSTGPAQEMLGLKSTESMPSRIGMIGGFLIMALLARKGRHSEGNRVWLYRLVTFVTFLTVAWASEYIIYSATVYVFVTAGAFAYAGATAVVFAFAFSIGHGVSNLITVSFVIAVLFAVAVYIVLSEIHPHRRNAAYGIYTLLMIFGLAISPALFILSGSWGLARLYLLFFGVLVFVNAPLDWLTLGVTRALLWRGIDRRGLSPFIWGLADIGVALLLLVILSTVTIIGIQLFNAVSMFGARDSVPFLNLTDLVAGIANPLTRGNSEYWWVYVTLLSTLLPSWVHLLVASGCFVRGSTRLNQIVAQELPLGKKGEPLLPHIQIKLAALLALQRTFGLALATAVFFGGLWFVLFILFPHLFPKLLDIAIPLSGSDWATGFVETIADMIGTLRSD